MPNALYLQILEKITIFFVQVHRLIDEKIQPNLSMIKVEDIINMNACQFSAMGIFLVERGV